MYMYMYVHISVTVGLIKVLAEYGVARISRLPKRDSLLCKREDSCAKEPSRNRPLLKEKKAMLSAFIVPPDAPPTHPILCSRVWLHIQG